MRFKMRPCNAAHRRAPFVQRNHFDARVGQCRLSTSSFGLFRRCNCWPPDSEGDSKCIRATQRIDEHRSSKEIMSMPEMPQWNVLCIARTLPIAGENETGDRSSKEIISMPESANNADSPHLSLASSVAAIVDHLTARAIQDVVVEYPC